MNELNTSSILGKCNRSFTGTVSSTDHENILSSKCARVMTYGRNVIEFLAGNIQSSMLTTSTERQYHPVCPDMTTVGPLDLENRSFFVNRIQSGRLRLQIPLLRLLPHLRLDGGVDRLFPIRGGLRLVQPPIVAARAFALSASYDSAIASWFGEQLGEEAPVVNRAYTHERARRLHPSYCAPRRSPYCTRPPPRPTTVPCPGGPPT